MPTAREIAADVDLRGRTCVITGSTAGLGRESARALAETGAHLILTGRDDDALASVASRIGAEVPGAQVSTVRLDLTSLAGVRRAAARISELTAAVHVLMNNAGVMFTPFARTADGFELQFGTNHLGHFELTRLLTPQLLAAGRARVVVLSSDGHRLADVDLTDPNWQARPYDKFAAYGASKTANLLHAVELDRRLREHGVRAYAVHPGVVATSLARHMAREDFAALGRLGPAEGAKVDVLRDFTTPDQAAATQVWAAVSPELADVGAVYLADCRIRDDAAGYATDAAHARELWAVSEHLCDR